MQPFGLALLSFALVVAASASPLLNANSKTTVDDIPVFTDYRPGDKCPARVFNDGCNTCICNDGINVACTLMDCPIYDEQKRAVRSEVPVFPHFRVGDKCPAKHFNDGCNDCVCGADGVTVACTLKACPNFDGQKRAVRSAEIPVFPNYRVGDKCPAPVFNDGCNSCICAADGVTAACTLRLCPNFDEQKRAVRSEVPVFPHFRVGDKCPAKYFNDGCNDCVCGADGVTVACTLKACPNFDGQKRAVRSAEIPVFPNYRAGDKCPAPVFNDGCNSCVCAADGVTAACTLRLCPEKRQTRSLAQNLPVVHGYQQGDKCPAQQFFDDCNRCACSADGHSAACTRMACNKRREARSVPVVPVVYGYKQGDKCPAQQFFNDCNRCACSADGNSAACTLMACPPVQRIDNFDEIQKCTPHQRFQKQCNGCVCGADGASAVCTLMACVE